MRQYNQYDPVVLFFYHFCQLIYSLFDVLWYCLAPFFLVIAVLLFFALLASFSIDFRDEIGNKLGDDGKIDFILFGLFGKCFLEIFEKILEFIRDWKVG